MERHAEDLVEVVVSEVGSPISLSRSMQVDDGFREFARATRSRSAEHFRPRDPVPPVTFLASKPRRKRDDP
jgi:hypothetical protein